jgi:LemA protein
MSSGLVVLWVIAGLIVLAVLYAWGLYNRLVTLRNLYRNGFADIDVQLKRRYDLIPNLVEAAKGYMSHERGTLEAVIAARGAAVSAAGKAAAAPGDPGAMRGLARAESDLGGALGRLLAVVEAYPELKANQNVLSLQGELSGTENEIAGARRLYNLQVMEYNNGRETFPAVAFSAMLGFMPAALLESTESAKERTPPKVTF